jgi:hypothetical protein
MAKTKCYHVTTADGEVYGVAATTKRDALQMTQDRLSREGRTDKPATAKLVATWDADYGTVLHYGYTAERAIRNVTR